MQLPVTLPGAALLLFQIFVDPFSQLWGILMPGSNIFGLFTHDRIIFVHTKGFDWVIRRKLIQVKTQVHRFPPGHRI